MQTMAKYLIYVSRYKKLLFIVLVENSTKKGDLVTANHTARDHKSPYASTLLNSGFKVKPSAKAFTNGV